MPFTQPIDYRIRALGRIGTDRSETPNAARRGPVASTIRWIQIVSTTKGTPTEGARNSVAAEILGRRFEALPPNGVVALIKPNKRDRMLNRVVTLGTILLFGAGVAVAESPDKQFELQMEKYLNSEAGQNMVGKAMEGYVKKRQDEARKKQDDMAKAQLEEQFKNPVSIDIGKSPVKGPANAKITIIEFSDFQCPFCTKGRKTMDDLMKANPNDVKLVFKHLPLAFHPEAMPAAKATFAAQQQGKFWEMHDALFDNQSSLGAELYESTAKKLGLDMEKFKKDMNSPAAEEAVKADMAIAEKNDIRGTPGFFVNGVAVKGAYPQSHFQMIIDRLLGKATANG